MIDQPLDLLYEAAGVRKLRVEIERSFGTQSGGDRLATAVLDDVGINRLLVKEALGVDAGR
jgi:hypothetical protein